jgi:putative membrane protein
MHTSVFRVATAVLLVLAAAACQRGGEPTGGDTTQTMLYPGVGDTAQPAPPLSDANILALLEQAHITDSAAGALAVTKATNSELRAFARMMVRDHHVLRMEGERVARRLRLTPELPPGDESVAETEATLAMLNGAERGQDFDKAYIDHEVAYHLDVLEAATAAMSLARETEVRAYIQKLAPMLRDHLDRAQALQRRLR